MSGTENNQLPAGWAWTTLGEICAKPEYGWTTKASEGGTVKLLRTTDITKSSLNWSSVPFCTANPPNIDRYRLHAGDIVISRAGSVGVSALIRECPKAIFASYLIRFRALDGVDPTYLLYFLKSPDYWHSVGSKVAGIALQNVNAKKLASIFVPLAPYDEQRRIVGEIEKQFTRLDAAVAALKRVQANLKRYRASVLKAAVEGRLVPTEAELARKEGRHYEPASKLLERILVERRTRWQAAQLAQMKAKGKSPKDNKWKAKYKDPVPLDTSNLPPLPEGWAWATLDQVLTSLRNGISTKPDAEAGIPILRISAVRPMMVNLDDARFLSGPLEKYSEFVLCLGDLLFTRYNGNPKLVGVCGVVKHLSRDTLYPDKLIRGKVLAGSCLAAYLEFVLNVGPSREFLNGRVRTTAGQSGISGGDLRQMPVPLAPLGEQRRIVAEIDRRSSFFDEIEEIVWADRMRAKRLRQAILKRAFRGKLVPQDASDEPASALLARIRAEREKIENGKRPRPYAHARRS